MTQIRRMLFGILALTFGAAPATAQSNPAQYGSAVAIGQDIEKKQNCPCCEELRGSQNPIGFFNRIITGLFGNTSFEIQVSVQKTGSKPATKCSETKTAVSCGSSKRTEKCAADQTCTATNACPPSCPVFDLFGFTGVATPSCEAGATCVSAPSVCADVASCVASASCCGKGKCACCKNCKCKGCGNARSDQCAARCGLSIADLSQCPYLAQIHGNNLNVYRRWNSPQVMVIRLGQSHPGFGPPVMPGPIHHGWPMPSVTQTYPPIPVGHPMPVYQCCPVAESRFPHPVAGTPVFFPQRPPQMPLAHPAAFVRASRPATTNNGGPIQIRTTKDGIQINAPGLRAQCDNVNYDGNSDVIEMQGNVKVEFHRNNRPAKIVAHHVIVHLEDGSFEVTPDRPTPGVIPTSYPAPRPPLPVVEPTIPTWNVVPAQRGRSIAPSKPRRLPRAATPDSEVVDENTTNRLAPVPDQFRP